MSLRRPMAPELVALGDTLEAALRRDIARRRARRMAFLNGLASVAVVVPVALTLTVGAFDGGGQGVGPAKAGPLVSTIPGLGPLAVSHIPEKPLPTPHAIAECLDGSDCRIRIPYTLQSPMGKI